MLVLSPISVSLELERWTPFLLTNPALFVCLLASGNSSILADKIALKLAGTDEGDSSMEPGYCLTEAGFGADVSQYQ